MKKKIIVILLLVIGIVLMCFSVVSAIAAAANKSIIGGADFPTFLYVFFRDNDGMYSSLAFGGFFALLLSMVISIGKKKS